MTHNDDREIQQLLKEVLPPVDRELRRDLWAAMSARLQASRTGLPWYDWALIAALSAWVLIYPEGILQLLYHL